MTADDVATAVIPLGAALAKESSGESEFDSLEKNVDITSVNDGKDYIYSEEAVKNFGWVFRTAKWDDVTIPANLLKRATEYLETTQYESLVMTLTAVDLSLFGQDYDSFDIGDRVFVQCSSVWDEESISDHGNENTSSAAGSGTAHTWRKPADDSDRTDFWKIFTDPERNDGC